MAFRLKQVMTNVLLAATGLSLFMFATASSALSQDGLVIEPRKEGQGPYNRLILRGAYLIDGTGAPTRGPVDIVVENDRITEIKTVGYPLLPIKPENRPPLNGGTEIDLTGMYIMPGFVDSHLHLHTPASGQNVPPEYVLKLWLSHGITSGRTLGGEGMMWELEQKKRLENNEITGPRILVYPVFDSSEAGPINTPEQARARIREIKKAGGSGIKFFGAPAEIMWAALDEADKQSLSSTMHHAQLDVNHANVLTTSEHGLKSMEHWYGLPEAMFEDKQIQRYPNDYIYHDEQDRFSEAGRLWKQAAKPGSAKWNEVMQTLLDRDFVLSPTFTAYQTSRDFMRMSRAKWHEEYTMPNLWEFYRPNRNAHGSYWFDWTLEDEIEWKNNYRLWMTFVNEYKNRGGKVIVGADAGYIYNLYGFGYIQEMELLQEAGFSSLEVLHAATLVGAKALGIDDEVGSIQVGKKADFVVTKENPLANLHVLLGTGHIRLNDETREVERVGGIKYTIKDGIIYDTTKMLADIRAMVKAEKDKLGIPPGPMPIITTGEE
ncbi:amidohydrolase family protein [Pseudemcibacter aquimaris]|uniref:amidohydrolase family protein n=1 Tax=Pseudemcibacter aquimaris TaxID=2857064 RepID=UPI0020113E77|nr:amidohydrolase family protein [Pseudemcibacter aquimaris]MCC3860414.1 amidohydrolase family protein [Pseudemcibacter aquimaris]WDU57740.1 amidohydrolase family protein [Pseudemcibacter aquimaris]